IFTHAALFGVTRHSSFSHSAPLEAPAAPAATTDIWSGDTSAISGGERLYEVAIDGPTKLAPGDPGIPAPATGGVQPPPEPPPNPAVPNGDQSEPDHASAVPPVKTPEDQDHAARLEPRAQDKPRRPPPSKRVQNPPHDIGRASGDPSTSEAKAPEPKGAGDG